MKLFGYYLSLFFLFSTLINNACNCVNLETISKQTCAKYNSIALVSVVKINNCIDEEVIVEVIVEELYKGKMEKQSQIKARCGLNCAFDFQEGTRWIFYLQRNNAQDLLLDFCEHSRLQLPEGELDFHTDLVGMSYDQELSFLRETFDVNAFFKNELKSRTYQKVSAKQTIIFLSIGLIVMVIGVIVIKKIN